MTILGALVKQHVKRGIREELSQISDEIGELIEYAESHLDGPKPATWLRKARRIVSVHKERL